jgi:hypothetical protein
MPVYDNNLQNADLRTAYDNLVDAEEYEDDHPLNVEDIGAIPIAALAIFIRMLLPEGLPTKASYWKTSMRRFACLAYSLQIEPIRKYSLTQLSEALGCSRALLSLLCVELRDFGKLDHRAGKSDPSREVYSARAKGLWSQRHRLAKAAKDREIKD